MKTACLILMFTMLAFAKDKNHTYQTGTVMSFHSQTGTGGFFDENGGFMGIDNERVYVIKTDSGKLEISPVSRRFSMVKGQTFQYRVDKQYLFVVVDGKEHRCELLSTE